MTQCIETRFESGLKDHAVFSSAFGELLIPLAAIVGYRATYKSGKNPKALMAGGLAAYGVGTYLYKKPQEEIYLTGVSSLECAKRQAAAVQLLPADVSLLEGVADQTYNAAFKGADEASFKEGKELADLSSKAIATAYDACPATNGNCRDLDSISKEQDATVRDQRFKLREYTARNQTARELARSKLSANDSADQTLCRVANQIRVDVNHMLYVQSADPGKLESLLSNLKFSPVAPVLTSTPSPPAAPATQQIHAKLSRAETAKLEDAFKLAVSGAKTAVEALESRVQNVRGASLDEDAVLKTCGVQSVAKPTPLAILANGPVEIMQGSELHVGLSGGRPFATTPAYRVVLTNPPSAGKLDANVSGDAINGYILVLKADDKATAKDGYSVVVADADGSMPTLAVKVVPKK